MNAAEIDNDIDVVYKEMILDLYRHPLNKKEIDNSDFSHRELNPNCGDDISISINFEGDTVKDIGHSGVGCAISQAAVSLLTDELKQKTKNDIKTFSKDDMLELLQIPISHTRLKCALLGWKVLQSI